MALLEYVNSDSATDRQRELLAADADYYGRPSLFARMLANAPDVFATRRRYHRELIDGGELGARIPELVYLAVSVTNDCLYCIASHREQLVEGVGLDSDEADALAKGDLEGFDQRERAAVEFATQMAADPKAVDEAHLTALRETGFDDAGVVRLVVVAAAAIAANAIADALAIHPGDRAEPFAS